jgi:hypothetical protein
MTFVYSLLGSRNKLLISTTTLSILLCPSHRASLFCRSRANLIMKPRGFLGYHSSKLSETKELLSSLSRIPGLDYAQTLGEASKSCLPTIL